MDPQSTVKLVAGILAVLLIGIVILRRKRKKKGEEEF
jgi:LPXTG-motif cell wall-anchored protein